MQFPAKPQAQTRLNLSKMFLPDLRIPDSFRSFHSLAACVNLLCGLNIQQIAKAMMPLGVKIALQSEASEQGNL